MVDACSQCLGFLLYSSGTTGVIPTRQQQMLEDQLQQEQETFLDGSLYDVYGVGGEPGW